VKENGDLNGIVTLDDIRELMFDSESQKTLKVKQLMHSPPEVINSNENMQNVMDKFEKSGAWNLPVTDSGKYLGFISKARIFHAYRKKLIRQNQD
jgi:CIC family chloride channel protein